MLHRCVFGGCSNVRSLENAIALHTIFYGNESLRDSSCISPPQASAEIIWIYVDQSQRTFRLWKCSLDPEKFCVRSLQGNGLRVIAIVIKEKVEHIDFMLWCRCLQRLDFVWLKQFAPVRFDSNRQTYSDVLLV